MTDAQALLSSMPIIEVVSIKYQESQEEEGSVEQKTKHPQNPRKPSKSIANAPFSNQKRWQSLTVCLASTSARSPKKKKVVWSRKLSIPRIPGIPASQ